MNEIFEMLLDNLGAVSFVLGGGLSGTIVRFVYMIRKNIKEFYTIDNVTAVIETTIEDYAENPDVLKTVLDKFKKSGNLDKAISFTRIFIETKLVEFEDRIITFQDRLYNGTSKDPKHTEEEIKKYRDLIIKYKKFYESIK